MIQIIDSLKWAEKAPHVLAAEKMGLPSRIRAYKTEADRKRAIGMLARRGYNYFVCYREGGILPRETGQFFALQFCFNEYHKTVSILW